MADAVWKSFKVAPADKGWEPAAYNVKWKDGREYGRWRRVLRKDPHGLTVISRYTAPPGKAWKIFGKASALGEEVYILDGAYYNNAGRIVAGPGTFMFNAPSAIHGGISCGLTLYIHCCSGEPDEIEARVCWSRRAGSDETPAGVGLAFTGPMVRAAIFVRVVLRSRPPRW